MDFFAGFIYYRTSLDPCGIDLLSIDHTEDHTAIVNINKKHSAKAAAQKHNSFRLGKICSYMYTSQQHRNKIHDKSCVLIPST